MTKKIPKTPYENHSEGEGYVADVTKEKVAALLKLYQLLQNVPLNLYMTHSKYIDQQIIFRIYKAYFDKQMIQLWSSPWKYERGEAE